MTEQKKTIQDMVAALVKEFSPEKIFLFGSYAWGTPTKDSDIDLLVILNQSNETPVNRIHRARKALRSFSMPKDILVKTKSDFERYSKVYASLESKVLEKGILLYG